MRTQNLFFYLLFILLFLAGFGLRRDIFIGAGGILTAVSWLILAGSRKRAVSFPKGTWMYIIFLLLFGISLIWSRDLLLSLATLMVFTIGGLFWIILFNLEKQAAVKIERIVYFLAIAFGLVLAVDYFLLPDLLVLKPFSLVKFITPEHLMLGDFWSVVILLALYRYLKDKKVLYFLLILLGAGIIMVSKSRSALFALGAGVFYLLFFAGKTVRNKKLIYLTLAFLGAIFIFFGLFKSTIGSRPYFLQSLVVLAKNPFGVGVGNFGDIVTQCELCRQISQSRFSIATHNLVLEILVGMGFLGLSLIFWLIIVFRDFLEKSTENKVVYKAASLVLLTNFFFFYTYFVLTMLWLFFVLLGVAQDKRETFAEKYARIAVSALSGLVIFFGALSITGIININFWS